MAEEDLCEFLCSKCGKIPLILNVHTDNSKIEFNCKNCGIYEILVDDYYDRLFKQNYFKKCSICENKGMYNNKFFYCENCKENICEICKKDHNIEHNCKEEKKKDHYFFNKCFKCENKKINKNKYYYCINCNNNLCQKCKDEKNCINKNAHKCIDEKEKKITCLDHNKTFKYFCLDCLENFCEECKLIKHLDHKNKKLQDLNSALVDNRNDILKINKELNNLVEFNETILKYTDIFENNVDYLQSIINIGKSLEEGNKRNTKDMKCLLKELAQDIQNSIKAINDLLVHKKKRPIPLSRNEKYIHINNKQLDDQDFKYISQIRFNQLKEIDISENSITNIEPFKKMKLPFLEFLNLSHNKIKFIKPLTKLKSEKLEYIFLQNNKIEDIETLAESDFPFLKILRAEDYNSDLKVKNAETRKEEDEKLLKIKKIYSERFIFKSIDQQKKDFKNKYELDISWDNESIDLSDVKGGQKMLKNLFLIITYMPKNKIKNLSLRNNDIKDPSLLNRINFSNLEILDLAVNYIEDLTFLLDIKAKNLKYLYLDNNKFKEIYQILKAKLPYLEVLSLNENKFESDEMEDSPIYLKLEEKEVLNQGKKIYIQLEKEKSHESKKKKVNEKDSNSEKSKEDNPKENTNIENSKEENPQEEISNL
jgi:hypothetical protein